MTRLRRVIFNPGSENLDVCSCLRVAGIGVVEVCILVLPDAGRLAGAA